MKIRSVKFNFIMNFLLTASSLIFPLITVPYVSRVLLVEGTGQVAFASSILTYFAMFASLGIPTYGIRACARVRDNKKELSKTVQEILILNTVTTVITIGIFFIMLFTVPKFIEQKELLLINSLSLVLNLVGVTWLYSALEQYGYIASRTVIFKVIAIIMMFLAVKNQEDVAIYAAISVFAGVGSNVLNFINLRKYVTLKKQGSYDFKKHLRPILVFFAMSSAISVYTNLDVVMLGFMQSDMEVGYYNAAIKVKTLLVSLITSLGTVLLPRLSYYYENKNMDEFERMIVKAFKFAIISGLSLCTYFTLLSTESILFLNGEEFLNAVWPMICLMPTVLFIGLSNVTGIQILTPTGNEKKVLWSIVLGAVIDFVLNLFLIPNFGALGAAFATMIAELIVLAVQIIYLKDLVLRVAKKMEFLKILISLVIATAGVAILMSITAFSPIITLVITAVVFYGIFGGLLIIFKENFVYGFTFGFANTIKNKLHK